LNLPDTLSLPSYIPITFGAAVLYALVQFYRIIRQSSTFSAKANLVMGDVFLWVIVQSVLAYTNYYRV